MYVWVTALAVVCIGLAAAFSPRDAATGAAEQAKAASDQKAIDLKEKRFDVAVGGAVMLRKAMRNPDSFKVSSAFVAEDASSVCYEYRSQNGFGGMNVAHVIATSSAFVGSSNPRFHALWKKNCSGKIGYEAAADVTSALWWYDKSHSN